MMDQGLSTDLSDFGEMIAEEQSTFEEPITILRWVSQPSVPGAFETPQPASYAAFPATAVVVEMSAAAKMFAAGVLSAGDLVIQIRDQIYEGNGNIGGSAMPDRVLFRGMEYRLVQRQYPITFGSGLSGDVAFYITHLRRTNSISDVVGL